jgi:ABC-type phosphate/phosphonate transport system substrate-binding protein
LETDLIFSQVCGYPLQTIFRGQATILGVPCYTANGCDGPTHRGVFVVGRDTPYRELGDLAGCRFVFNSIHSNSGMNLPRRAVAEIAGSRPFFRSVTEGGGHPANLERIVAGEFDATCVDCVTYALCCRYRQAVREGTRVLARTPSSPAIPFVTSAMTPGWIVQALRSAMMRVGSVPRYRTVRSDLLINEIVPADESAYARLLDFEREAAELGYPRLA